MSDKELAEVRARMEAYARREAARRISDAMDDAEVPAAVRAQVEALALGGVSYTINDQGDLHASAEGRSVDIASRVQRFIARNPHFIGGVGVAMTSGETVGEIARGLSMEDDAKPAEPKKGAQRPRTLLESMRPDDMSPAMLIRLGLDGESK